MPAAYPILLDVTQKRVVIVGGGGVALRKVTKLVEAGALNITVVSPNFVEGFPEAARKVAEVYKAEHLAGAELVFAATDSPAVNAAVVRDGRNVRALVCRADSDEDGDFAVPAVLRAGAVVVGVSAGSPALAAAIRDGVQNRWDARWTAMSLAQQTLRPLILRSGLPAQDRKELLRELASNEAMDVLGSGGIESLRDWIVRKVNGRKRT